MRNGLNRRTTTAGISQDDLNAKFYELLVVYNKRFDDVEVEKSVMIEIPPNLAPKEERYGSDSK